MACIAVHPDCMHCFHPLIACITVGTALFILLPFTLIACIAVGTMLFILLPSILDKSKLAPGEKPKELLPRIAMAVEVWIVGCDCSGHGCVLRLTDAHGFRCIGAW